nr:hypothetical protein [uncultured Duganella sp.]
MSQTIPYGHFSDDQLIEPFRVLIKSRDTLIFMRPISPSLKDRLMKSFTEEGDIESLEWLSEKLPK